MSSSIQQNGSVIRKFAMSLINRVPDTVYDKLRGLLGVPLLCRIFAESYESDLQEIISNNTKNSVEIGKSLGNMQDFDIISLYRRFMETKRKIFRKEKANSSTYNEITDKATDYLIKEIESHLTKRAIETIFTDQEKVDILWPPSTSHKSEAEIAEKENMMVEFGLKFGLTYREERIRRHSSTIEPLLNI